MNYNCNTVAVGQPLSSWQQAGLSLVSRIYGGRDVIFAIDLTDSVGLNDEGRIRLTQIIEDSLRRGDTVYIVPFASSVNPLAPDTNSLTTGIQFRGQEDIDEILETVPFKSDLSLSNTDIQQAEAYIYNGLAQLNQCRLVDGKAIKPQSVIWLTDAPLLTSPGVTSDIWIETPANSPFRVADSEASLARASWLEALPLTKRSRQIDGNDSKSYQLTVVDVNPTVQEFCTPAPGGKETCLVTAYIFKMLWLPTTILIVFLVATGIGSKYLISLKKKWRVKVSYESDDIREQQTCYVKNGQQITIGEDSINGIYCPGDEIRGYLKRKGNSLYIIPTRIAPLFYRDREITQPLKVTSNYLSLNCPYLKKDFEITIKIFGK